MKLAPSIALCLIATASSELHATTATVEQLENTVREREQAFAATMTARDLTAFGSFLAADAVFVGREANRGREAVLAAWRPYFEGAAPFSWAPERVVVLDSGRLALSSGPVYAPSGERAGTFNSVWRLEDDGVWRVVLDNGCPRCECPRDDPDPASATAATASADPIDGLAWLAGCWSSVGGEPGSGECWLAPAGGAMIGLSRTVRGGKVVAHELVQIRQVDGVLAYVALPSGQSEATFPLARSGPFELVFENPEHDFPQRIVYRLDGDRLDARIEGAMDGTERSIPFPMVRAAHPFLAVGASP